MPASKRKLDMTNVKDASPFNSKHMPEGDYAAVIVDVADQESKSGNDMWVYTIRLKDYPRAVYAYYCVLEERSLFKVRHLFTAAGIDLPRSVKLIDPNKIVGKEIGVGLEDEEYDGNMRSKITAVMELKDMAVNNSAPDLDEDDEEEEPTPPKRAAKAPVTRKRRAPEPEDDEDEEEEDEEPEPPKRKAPVKRARKPAPVVEDDEEEDDDEEEEPEPPRKTRSAASRTRAATTRKAPVKKRPVADEDDEDEDEMELDDL